MPSTSSPPARTGPALYRHHQRSRRRIAEHKSDAIKGYAARYDIDRLVYVETFDEPNQAIEREKVLKKWRRAWKVALIEKENPAWTDLAG